MSSIIFDLKMIDSALIYIIIFLSILFFSIAEQMMKSLYPGHSLLWQGMGCHEQLGYIDPTIHQILLNFHGLITSPSCTISGSHHAIFPQNTQTRAITIMYVHWTTFENGTQDGGTIQLSEKVQFVFEFRLVGVADYVRVMTLNSRISISHTSYTYI